MLSKERLPEDLLKGTGLSKCSDDGVEDPSIEIYGGKQPKLWIKKMIDSTWREKNRTQQVAMGNKGRGKVGITYNPSMVHRDDEPRSSGNDSSEEEIFLAPSDAGVQEEKDTINTSTGKTFEEVEKV